MKPIWIAFAVALGLAAAPAMAQERRPAQPSAQDQRKIDKDDREFMEKAARLGIAELEASKLAAQKASSEQVREFAKQMVQDHTRSNQELQQLASKKGVQLPAEPDRGHQRALKKLQDLSGPKFDNEYMANAGVKDHDETVDLFRDAQKDVKDAEVRAFIDKTLPVLQKHHQRAKTVHAAIEKDSAVGAGRK